METIILCTVFGVFILISFITGAVIGQKVSKKESISIKSPAKIIKEHKVKKQIEAKELRENQISEINEYNIDNYDGTGLGQKDFPQF